MEIDPEAKGGGALVDGFGLGGGETGEMEGMTEEMQSQGSNLMTEIKNSIPGIDEATSFG